MKAEAERLPSTKSYRVVRATEEQREALRGHSEASYERGLMDTLILQMSASQVRSAHEDHRLQGISVLDKAQHDNMDLDRVPNPAEIIRPAAIIKREG